MASDDGSKIWLVLKTIVATAGTIYLLHLLTWFLHWGVVLAAVGGVGFIAYRVGTALSGPTTSTKLLQSEPSFDDELARLEAEEHVLDRRIGIR